MVDSRRKRLLEKRFWIIKKSYTYSWSYDWFFQIDITALKQFMQIYTYNIHWTTLRTNCIIVLGLTEHNY